VAAPLDFFSLTDAKTYLGIALTDTSQDALLELILPSATQAVVDLLCWDPNSQEVNERYNGTGAPAIVVNRKCISAVASVAIENPITGTQNVLDPSHYFFDGQKILSRRGPYPRGQKNIIVSYTAGLVPIPASIVLAAKMTLKAMWSGKDFEQNATGSEVPDVESLTFWPTGPGAVPPQARSLLMKYRIEMLVS
jgi:hypothetical protein